MRAVLFSLLLWTCTGVMAQSIKVEPFPSKKFGTLNVYRSSHANEIVLFISGNGDWNSTLAGAARTLVKRGALVVGININHYWSFVRKSSRPCVHLSEDFEALSRYLQFKNWIPRVLSCYDKIVNPETIKKKDSSGFPLEIVNTDSDPDMPQILISLYGKPKLSEQFL